MVELGQWVLGAACRQIREWLDAGETPPPVGINISASQFSSPTLIDDIEAALDRYKLPAERLEVELTESTSMHNPQNSIAIMTQLRRRGIRLSIDDFGTGYSNLSYLKRFPVHRLKLDKAFVHDIMDNPDDLAISHAVIAMAHQLRLEVIAEGVETTGQLALLAAAKCDSVQGYLFSLPVPAPACQQLLGRVFADAEAAADDVTGLGENGPG
jgi:EAL domain-containing protein (putative c-di-GMP-specific phosphodiesterase class I)